MTPADTMRARAAEAAREAREAAELAHDEADMLRAELESLRHAVEAGRQAAAGAARARLDSDRMRVLLHESQLRESRLQRDLDRLGADNQRLVERIDLLPDLERLLGSRLFDADWYRARYPDVAASGLDPALHFVRIGSAENRDPGPLFDASAYVADHPDVAASGMGALLHYLKHGAAEGRERRAVDPDAPLPQPLPGAPARVAGPGGPRIAFLSGEPDTPGHVYRVLRAAAAAVAMGATTLVLRPDEVDAHLDEIAGADVVVIWRAPWSQPVATAVTAARAGTAQLVFDLDDLMIDPDLARVEVIDGIRSQDLTAEAVRDHYARLRQTMAAADFCLASTDELATHLRRHAKPTLVLANGYDADTLRAARRAVRHWHHTPADSLLRIGYAAGSRTHQRDFAVAAEAVGRVLRRRRDCRLVLFRDPRGGRPLLDLDEFPALGGLHDRVEWRDLVPLERLPEELARFDINIVPLEVGNPFCEAKSELKYHEAALVDVPTVASATGPFARAIDHGRSGFLATTPADWHASLSLLVDDPAVRRRVATAAHLDVLWRFGPDCRIDRIASALDQIQGGRVAARAFERDVLRAAMPAARVEVPDSETVFLADALGEAEVTVVIPLHNYAHHVEEALESVRRQTLGGIDLVVVDDASTDDGLAVALAWVRRHRPRFNRVAVLRNVVNAGLGLTRNAGFAAAETSYVLPLDADNRLRARCCERLLAEAVAANAAFAYPVIREFGEASGRRGLWPYAPARLVGVPYIDAMALVSRAAWAGVGGYAAMRHGWEDYDFWCRMAERGMHGIRVAGEPLAEYRVHAGSMLHTVTETHDHKPRVLADMARRHPWLSLAEAPRAAPPPLTVPVPAEVSALAALLPLLRCPVTGQTLSLDPADDCLRTPDGRRWPLVLGRPVLFAGMPAPRIIAGHHVSNELPESALAVIRAADGPVLNLSAGGTAARLPNVIEVEAAIFRHTTVVADAHALPFADGVFAAVVVLNAFEHYRDPQRVAAELFRVLRPGGRLLIQTAFLQPLHEAPAHFYNATRHGIAAWFAAFDTDLLHVPDNFSPAHTLSWLAHEAREAVRRELPEAAAHAFSDVPVGHFAELWTRAEQRVGDPGWNALHRLPQASRDIIAAGFEFVGRRPPAPGGGAPGQSR